MSARSNPPTTHEVPRRWIGALLGVRGAVPIGGLGSAGLLVGLTSASACVVLTILAATFALQHVIHLHLRYRRQRGSKGRRLRGLMRTKAAIVAVFLALSVVGDLSPPTATTVAIVAIAFFLVVMLLSGAVIRAADALDLMRGSAWIKTTGPFRCVNYSLAPHSKNFSKLVLRVLNAERPAGEASWYVVCLLSLLLMIGAAEGAAATPWLRGVQLLGGATGAGVRSGQGSAGLRPPRAVSDGKPPTYEQLCASGVPPGYPAPPPMAEGLKSVFLEAGAFVAGCAGPANPVPGHRVWWAVGSCKGETRSLGIAVEGEPSALLLQQVARFAEVKAAAGVLVGASSRVPAVNGDFQIIETTNGDYVAARATSSLGELQPPREVRSCGDLDDRNAPYTIAPPGLLGLWAKLARHAWTWPVRRAADEFFFVSGSGDPLGVVATCTSDLSCSMMIDGTPISSDESSRRAAESLELSAPGAGTEQS